MALLSLESAMNPTLLALLMQNAVLQLLSDEDSWASSLFDPAKLTCPSLFVEAPQPALQSF